MKMKHRLLGKSNYILILLNIWVQPIGQIQLQNKTRLFKFLDLVRFESEVWWYLQSEPISWPNWYNSNTHTIFDNLHH